MNLEFVTIDRMERDGVPCVLQRAVVPGDNRQFWIMWKTCVDKRLKETHMLRKEGDPPRWAVYRTIPDGTGMNLGPLPIPYVLKSTRNLLAYQPRAVAGIVRSLTDSGSAVDGSDTGLGKSYTALAAARELNLRPAIICKKAGVAGWRRACAYMGSDPLFIINWELARRGFRYAMRVQDEWSGVYKYKWALPRNTLLIFDECHMGMNEDTLNGHLWTDAPQPLLSLSATLADRPVRLANLFKTLGVCDQQQYRQWLMRRGAFTNNHNELESMAAVQDMQTIHEILYPRHGCRLSYQDDDVKSYFPDVNYQIELVSLDRVEQETENEAYKEMLEKVRALREAGRTHAELMVEEMRYRQAAELLKAPILADYVQEYLSQGLSVAVFVNFRDTLAQLAKMLQTRSLIFGDQERHGLKREDVVAAFQANRETVILCMADAGGASIDLHDLKGGHQRVSLICPTYNPVHLKQVLGRTRRAGSKTTPIIKLVYAANTIEEKVANAVAMKLDNIEALNRGDLMEPDLFNMKGEDDDEGC